MFVTWFHFTQNAKEGNGGTPLNEAVLWGNNEVAGILRKHGAKATPKSYADTVAGRPVTTGKIRTKKSGPIKGFVKSLSPFDTALEILEYKGLKSLKGKAMKRAKK